MPISKALLHFVAASSLAVAASAQAITVTEANMIVTTAGLSVSANTPRLFDLKADALLVDHGFEHGWYFRIAGDTSESTFRNLGGVNTGGFGPTHGDRDFANAESRGQLRVSMDYDVYSSGPASGVFLSRCTVMNISNAPLTLDMFAYADLDIANTSGDDTCYGTNSSHFVSDASGVQVEVRAIGNDLSQFSSYPSIRNQLIDNAVTTLTGNPPSFLGDYTGAFQWTGRTLQPFEQRTFTVAFAVDTAAVALPLVENYGAGNGDDLQIHTQFLPLQDNSTTRNFAIQLKGAQPNAEYRIAIGQAPWTPSPFIPGIDLWIDPFQLVGIYGGFTNGTGDSFELFFIPPSPYLTGFSIFGQVFAVDPAAPNGFAYFSAGMRMRVGKL